MNKIEILDTNPSKSRELPSRAAEKVDQ